MRHRPGPSMAGCTLQLNNPALLAESAPASPWWRTCAAVMSPPAAGRRRWCRLHQGMFGQAGRSVGVLNLGGISNLSLLRADGGVLGFDCGPANALMDYWCERHTGRTS